MWTFNASVAQVRPQEVLFKRLWKKIHISVNEVKDLTYLSSLPAPAIDPSGEEDLLSELVED